MWCSPIDPAIKTTTKTPIPIGIAVMIPSVTLNKTTPHPDSVA